MAGPSFGRFEDLHREVLFDGEVVGLLSHGPKFQPTSMWSALRPFEKEAVFTFLSGMGYVRA